MIKHSNHISTAQVFQLDEQVTYDHIFREYFPALCYFARRFLKNKQDTEDLVMNCFTKLWEKRISLQHSETVKTFLYTTVRNACIDLLRKKNVQVVFIKSHMEELISDAESNFIDYLVETEVFREIFAAAETLPNQIRKVFDLYFIEGKNEHEISKELHTSYHTVRNQRQRAITLLRGKLQAIRKQALFVNIFLLGVVFTQL